MAYKVTFNETTFEFSFNKEETFNYGGKNDVTLETEIFDVLIDGIKSVYYVQFDTKSESYSVWSGKTDKFGGITHRELTPFGIDGSKYPARFPIDVVCDIVKTIDTYFVR
jgi:hypothetical protein